MEIRNTFEVDAVPERVYETLVDLERVGPTIPGATIGSPVGDGAHPAKIVVKLGPMRMTYAGTVRIVERDDANRRAVLFADVKETRGQGTARATMTMHVAAAGRAARVDSVTQVDMAGRAAAMGQGIIEDVATRLVGQMAENLSGQLASTEPASNAAAPSAAPGEATPAPAPVTPAPAPAVPAQAVNGIALLLKVLQDRIARLLKRKR